MVNGEELKNIFNKINIVIEENKLYLSELDAAIGDGDHGLNMSKGFKAVVKKINDLEEDDLGKILKACGMALVTNVGGASGPLYGTALLNGSKAVAKKTCININDFIEILQASLDGIKMIGKAMEGEKTMIDALSPALEAGRKALGENKSSKDILIAIRDAAKEGMENTKNIIATKGRASYLDERSLGHQDAGATSMYLILNTIAEEFMS
ncbi:dihydroxyacetone kinase subunit DhaL [Clostridium butyricum]|uniref:dihydroxyacetone kinase subunit DhaL n=1 Tax=Clostridium butyricum TaxID=1492 RepID=UPI0012B79650|nr:dihydroxyacetone kinase subunit DhaL [Clostridium butyricum]MBS5983343.1 dihydroxyacetone kinase subunit L [Clostridium butyricum]